MADANSNLICIPSDSLSRIISFLWFKDILHIFQTCTTLKITINESQPLLWELLVSLVERSGRKIAAHRPVYFKIDFNTLSTLGSRLTQWPTDPDIALLAKSAFARRNYSIKEVKVLGQVNRCMAYQGTSPGENRCFVANDHFPTLAGPKSRIAARSQIRPYSAVPFTKIITDPVSRQNIPVLSCVAYYEIKIHPPSYPENVNPNASGRFEGPTANSMNWDLPPCISLGIARPLFKLNGYMPGWDCHSFGYHGDDGMYYNGRSTRGFAFPEGGEDSTNAKSAISSTSSSSSADQTKKASSATSSTNPRGKGDNTNSIDPREDFIQRHMNHLGINTKFGEGDIVGCGIIYPPLHCFEIETPISFSHASIFFTKNGQLVGSFPLKDPAFFQYTWFPVVGTDAYNPIEMNFGSSGVPFAFDVLGFERDYLLPTRNLRARSMCWSLNNFAHDFQSRHLHAPNDQKLSKNELSGLVMDHFRFLKHADQVELLLKAQRLFVYLEKEESLLHPAQSLKLTMNDFLQYNSDLMQKGSLYGDYYGISKKRAVFQLYSDPFDFFRGSYTLPGYHQYISNKPPLHCKIPASLKFSTSSTGEAQNTEKYSSSGSDAAKSPHLLISNPISALSSTASNAKASFVKASSMLSKAVMSTASSTTAAFRTKGNNYVLSSSSSQEKDSNISEMNLSQGGHVAAHDDLWKTSSPSTELQANSPSLPVMELSISSKSTNETCNASNENSNQRKSDITSKESSIAVGSVDISDIKNSDKCDELKEVESTAKQSVPASLSSSSYPSSASSSSSSSFPSSSSSSSSASSSSPLSFSKLGQPSNSQHMQINTNNSAATSSALSSLSRGDTSAAITSTVVPNQGLGDAIIASGGSTSLNSLYMHADLIAENKFHFYRSLQRSAQPLTAIENIILLAPEATMSGSDYEDDEEDEEDDDEYYDDEEDLDEDLDLEDDEDDYSEVDEEYDTENEEHDLDDFMAADEGDVEEEDNEDEDDNIDDFMGGQHHHSDLEDLDILNADVLRIIDQKRAREEQHLMDYLDGCEAANAAAKEEDEHQKQMKDRDSSS